MAKPRRTTPPPDGEAPAPKRSAGKVHVARTPEAEPASTKAPEGEPSEAAADEVKRRKPDDQRKETQLHIRITDAQKEALTRAAAREGLELSAWVRSTLLKAAGATPK